MVSQHLRSVDRSLNHESSVVELVSALKVDGEKGLSAYDSRVEDLSLSGELLTSGDDCWKGERAKRFSFGDDSSRSQEGPIRLTESSSGGLSDLGVLSTVGEDEQELGHADLTELAKLGAGVDEFDNERLEGRGGEDGVRFLDMSEVQSDEPVEWYREPDRSAFQFGEGRAR